MCLTFCRTSLLCPGLPTFLGPVQKPEGMEKGMEGGRMGSPAWTPPLHSIGALSPVCRTAA